jgi:hypothetical protein
MPRSSSLISAVALVTAVVLGGSAPAYARAAAVSPAGDLQVSSYKVSGKPATVVFLNAFAAVDGVAAPTAAVTIGVPRGYGLDVRRPVGATVGEAIAILGDASGGTDSPDPLSGSLVVDDPALYAQDPDAQACAPGSHAAVWRVQPSDPSQTLRMLVFVDPVSVGTGGYALRFCPLWPPSAGNPGGLFAPAIGLALQGVAAPTAQGVYTWSAVVTPADPTTRGAVPSQAFELRAVLPFPNVLTLRARHDPKTRSVLLSGKLMAAGKPVTGVPVTVTAYTGTYDYTEYGAVRTDGNGAYSLRRAIDRTTVFEAEAAIPPQDCSGPSPAPGGCVGESVASPGQPSTSLRVPRVTDPRRAIRKADEKLARRAALRRGDFAADWQTGEPSPFSVCEGFQPNQADLTLTGEARSPLFLSQRAAAVSDASVFATVQQAHASFRRTAQLAVARCLARDLRDNDIKVLQMGTLGLPQTADETRAFRVIGDEGDDVVYFDLVYLRRGRTVVNLQITTLTQPLLEEQDLVAKVTARLRGS